MAVEIIDRQKSVSIDRRAVRRLVGRILKDHSQSDSDATIVFADDRFVRELNLASRGVARPTDVLAFAMGDAAGLGGAGDGEEPEAVLGDIVISVDRAAVQARRFRRTAAHEIMKLTAHGVLHLLGYDHQKDDERRRMRKLENRYAREALAATPGGGSGRRTGS